MANVVPADRTAADKAGDFGRGLGYAAAQTIGGETFDARAKIDEGAIDADLVNTTELDAAIAAEAVGTGTPQFVTVSLDGADETTPPGEIYAVTGLAAADILVSVLFVSTKASVATIEVLDPADFTVGADTLTSLDEVNRTNDQLIVTYIDVS